MNALPASRGVRELVMVSPATSPLSGCRGARRVDRVIGIGGAQAVGALAYGTQPYRASTRTSPGNVYVAEAKRQVFGQVASMVAGPSEILVIADGRTPAAWVGHGTVSSAEPTAAQAYGRPQSPGFPMARRPCRCRPARTPGAWPRRHRRCRGDDLVDARYGLRAVREARRLPARAMPITRSTPASAAAARPAGW